MPMNLAPSVLRTLFHSIFDVVRSAVLVVSSPGYLIRFPPAVIRVRFGSAFWGAEVDHDLCVGHDSVFWNVSNLVVVHDKDRVRTFGLCFYVTLCHITELLAQARGPGWS